ncbi:MAG: hypothetical protein CENE_01171 [Candidatus Celerinatantimonas neptuna]|nr:MAG: hypothetical protein CENE_01171 [Candidatus Celerinatantimonas neptuna]
MKHDHIDRILQQWQQQRPDLDCSPMAVLGRLSRIQPSVQKQLNTVFSSFDLSTIEFDILATLRRSGKPLTPTELYQTLMLSSGAMSTRLEKLVKRGLLERLANAEDRRSCTIELTSKGLKLIDKALEAHIANEKIILKPLDQNEQIQLASLLRRWLIHCERNSDL